MKRTLLAGVAAAAALMLTACSGTSGDTSNGTSGASGSSGQARTLTIAMSSDVTSFAPQNAGDGPAVPWTQAAYDTLIRQQPDGSFVPMLAKSWKYDADQTTLTFTLQSGVTFQDGAALDATAVKKNLEATRDGTGILSTQLASIKSIDAPSADTVVLHLGEPDPALLRSLSQPSGMIASPAEVGSKDLDTTPDGTGPYVLDAADTVRGSTYTFTKKSDYWDKSLSLPYSTIVYKVMTDTTARVNALMSGQVDAAYIDQNTLAQVKGAGLHTYTYPGAGVFGLFLLDRDGKIQPALKDVRVRQAINLALDRKTIVSKLLLGQGVATEQVFNPQGTAYDATLDSTYAFDPAKAKALMAAAGYAKGFSLEMPSLGTPVETILTQELGAIGINVKFKSVAATDFISEVQSRKYPVIEFQLQSTEPWQTIQFMVAPKAPWNEFGTTDPKVTALIATIQHSTGATQTTAYKALNTYLVQQAWFAPLYFANTIYATGKNTTVVPAYEQSAPSIYTYSPAS
jgi:peptide/nickel transport system substrate-binding protein